MWQWTFLLTKLCTFNRRIHGSVGNIVYLLQLDVAEMPRPNKPAPMSLAMWLTTTFILSSASVQGAATPAVSEAAGRGTNAAVALCVHQPAIVNSSTPTVVKNMHNHALGITHWHTPNNTMGTIVDPELQIGLTVHKKTVDSH